MKISPALLLETIERIVADDFCEDLDCMVAFHPDDLTEREKVCYEKLSAVYRLVHSLNAAHSCHHVHKPWRKEALKLLRNTQAELEHEGR